MGRAVRMVAGLLVMLLASGCATGDGPVTPSPKPRTSDPPVVSPVVSAASPTIPPPTEATPAPATSPTPRPSVPTPDPADPTPIPGTGEPAAALHDLVTPDGDTFDLADLAGHPVLLFFGYTHCPDVCPMTVGDLVLALRERPETRVVFVTVDPERDTQATLGEWLRYLPEGFEALTGSPSAIRAAADAYGVRYARVDSGSAAGYAMSHTAFVYLIDEEGRMRLTFPFGSGWATMVRGLDESSTSVQENRT